MNSPIRVAMIDDHQIVINGVLAMLAGAPGIEVLFTTTQPQQLFTFLAERQPDILLTDIQMPELDGIDLCRQVTRQYPGVRVIALSSFDDTHYVKQILRQGAQGYLLKNTDAANLLQALQTVHGGEQFIDGILQKKMLQETLTGQRRSLYEVPLTKREKEILKLIAEEQTNQQIADQLFISLRTVETHRLNLTQKLGVKNAAGLVKEAMKRGLI